MTLGTLFMFGKIIIPKNIKICVCTRFLIQQNIFLPPTCLPRDMSDAKNNIGRSERVDKQMLF
jgi:hypothetical protein